MSSLQLCKHTVSFIIIHYLKVYEERAHDVHICRGRNSTTGASHTSFLLPYIRQWWKSRLAPLESQHIVDGDLEPMGFQLHSAGCPCAFFQTSDLLSPRSTSRNCCSLSLFLVRHEDGSLRHRMITLWLLAYYHFGSLFVMLSVSLSKTTRHFQQVLLISYQTKRKVFLDIAKLFFWTISVFREGISIHSNTMTVIHRLSFCGVSCIAVCVQLQNDTDMRGHYLFRCKVAFFLQQMFICLLCFECYSLVFWATLGFIKFACVLVLWWHFENLLASLRHCPLSSYHFFSTEVWNPVLFFFSIQTAVM